MPQRVTRGKALIGKVRTDGIELAGTPITASGEQLNRLKAVTGYPIECQEATFEEDGEGTYTGEVAVPAGATLLDIIVHAEALWTAATSATMKVGDDTDDDGYYTGVNLKATDLLAGESLSFSQSGGKAGAYNTGTNTHWANRYSSAERTITGTITSVGAGTDGRTRMLVVYALPTPTAATKA